MNLIDRYFWRTWHWFIRRWALFVEPLAESQNSRCEIVRLSRILESFWQYIIFFVVDACSLGWLSLSNDRSYQLWKLSAGMDKSFTIIVSLHSPSASQPEMRDVGRKVKKIHPPDRRADHGSVSESNSIINATSIGFGNSNNGSRRLYRLGRSKW